METRKTQSPKIKERRFFTGLEVRESEEQPGVIEGIAAKVGEEYDMGWYREKILPGAFDAVMEDDVRVLKNHDSNYILGRTKSGTAEIFLTSEGHLGYKYATPNRSYAKDLEDEIRTGDIDQSSFAFIIRKQTWREEKRGDKWVEIREIEEIEQLFDVSPVTYPANPNTEVGKRAWEQRQAEKAAEKEAISTEQSKREARLREVNLSILNQQI